MTTYTWTDNTMRSGSTCDVDKVADNLMHLKYNAGGLLPTNNMGTKTSNFTLDINKIDIADITAALTISLPTTGFISGVENKCILDFTTTSTSSPTLPTGLKWSNRNGGVAPSSYSSVSGIRNVLTFTTIDGGTTWEADYYYLGGIETAFARPSLTANGTLGGSSFAVSASSSYVNNPAYYAVDSNTSTAWISDSAIPASFIFYNPNALKVSTLTILNRIIGSYVYSIRDYTVFGSNDNSNWTTLTSGQNTNNTDSYSWQISVNSSTFYKYYKITATSTNYGTGVGSVGDVGITATYMQT